MDFIVAGFRKTNDDIGYDVGIDGVKQSLEWRRFQAFNQAHDGQQFAFGNMKCIAYRVETAVSYIVQMMTHDFFG